MSERDRLYYSKSARGIVEKIDEHDFFSLSKTSGVSRTELFLFAMSQGIKFKAKLGASEGFILDKSIKDDAQSLFCALTLSSCKSEEEYAKALEKNYVYEYVEQCAEAGFMIIDNWLSEKSEETIELELLDKLDGLYDEYFKK